MTGDRQARKKKSAAKIEAGNVTELLRLANHLHRVPRDPMLRKMQLLDGLVAMSAADGGACAVLHDDGGPVPVVLSVASGNGSPRKRAARRARGARGDRGGFHEHPEQAELVGRISNVVRRDGRRRKADVDGSHSITAVVRLDGGGIYGGVTLVRRADGKAFEAEQRAMIELFHQEMGWVYELDLPLASPEVGSLPPRARETLQYLLAGLGEKEIAARLELSHNTVHHYVKQLYRHFVVSSRSELLARWVREDGPTSHR
jgi:DNA-binding CsgD family transcriptional regulator